MNEPGPTLPLSILDFLGIEYGETAADCMAGGVKQHPVDELGVRLRILPPAPVGCPQQLSARMRHD
jgi:hypothetical protein